MNKNYKKITFPAGTSIDEAFLMLKFQDELACGNFNGVTLYSDLDTLNSAYQKITGNNKAEFEALLKGEREKAEKEKNDHFNNIPKLTRELIEKGKMILDSKYQESWMQLVPIKLKNYYRGADLKSALEIIDHLNQDGDLKIAKHIIDSQNHSGYSFNQVCFLVKQFCERGEVFVKYVK